MFIKSSGLIALVFFANAHGSEASGLRGVPGSADSSIQRRVLKKSPLVDCGYDPAVQPPPSQCPAGQIATYDLRACDWACRDAPTNHYPTSPTTPPRPIQQPIEPPVLEAQEPTQPTCPEGQVPILSWQTKEYSCVTPHIMCPEGQNLMYDAVRLTFWCAAATPQKFTATTAAAATAPQTRSVTGSSRSQCKYNALDNPIPTNCPTNHAAFFNHWNCAWICSPNNNGAPTQTNPPVMECEENHVIFWDLQTSTFQCVQEISCSGSQYIIFDPVSQFFHCRNI